MSAIDPVLESLKERGWRDVAVIDQALAEARITEDGWNPDVHGGQRTHRSRAARRQPIGPALVLDR